MHLQNVCKRRTHEESIDLYNVHAKWTLKKSSDVQLVSDQCGQSKSPNMVQKTSRRNAICHSASINVFTHSSVMQHARMEASLP